MSAAEEVMSVDRIDAIVMRVGVNMGDHAETTWRSVEVGENETVRDLMERLIEKGSGWRPRDYDSWVRLSFVEPRPSTEAPGINEDVFS